MAILRLCKHSITNRYIVPRAQFPPSMTTRVDRNGLHHRFYLWRNPGLHRIPCTFLISQQPLQEEKKSTTFSAPEKAQGSRAKTLHLRRRGSRRREHVDDNPASAGARIIINYPLLARKLTNLNEIKVSSAAAEVLLILSRGKSVFMRVPFLKR